LQSPSLSNAGAALEDRRNRCSRVATESDANILCVKAHNCGSNFSAEMVGGREVRSYNSIVHFYTTKAFHPTLIPQDRTSGSQGGANETLASPQLPTRCLISSHLVKKTFDLNTRAIHTNPSRPPAPRISPARQPRNERSAAIQQLVATRRLFTSKQYAFGQIRCQKRGAGPSGPNVRGLSCDPSSTSEID